MGASFSMARDGDSLLFSAGKMTASAADHGIKAVLQRHDAVVAATVARGLFDLGIGGVRSAHADVLPDGGVE